jgi:hypothetical protein
MRSLALNGAAMLMGMLLNGLRRRLRPDRSERRGEPIPLGSGPGCGPKMRHFTKYLALLRDIPTLEHLTMRALTLSGATILAAALITSCGAEAGPTAENALGLTADAADLNTPQHTKLVEPFTEPLTNPCNGEVIVFSGEAITQITDVGGLHSELTGSASGTGTGPESNATYEYNLVFHESFNTPSETAPQANFFGNANARVRSSIRDLSFTAHFVFHGVALPSGEFKITRNLDRVECKA